MQRPATIRHRTSLFDDAVAIVEQEFASDLALDDIARRVASSRRQLQRAYAEIGDTTFREHLTAVRMERAAELLDTRSLTVREVANRVGYRQPAQFAKAFRRHHGMAPSDYRTERRASADSGIGRFSRDGFGTRDGHGASSNGHDGASSHDGHGAASSHDGRGPTSSNGGPFSRSAA
jgi:AraC family transcriptional regulator, regulatory protein of adaptative response / methylphosphotriester-DNA alkyltransferase methyltransferase